MLDTKLLLDAYSVGFFPMADQRSGTIGWYSPDPRAVIPLSGFHVPKTLKRLIRKGVFRVTCDADFRGVIEGCSARSETWISREIVESYTVLHSKGFAHSVECWKESNLVGGLYGVSIKGAFFGESMFSSEPGASQIALVHLVTRLRENGFLLLDTQFLNPHIARFGGMEIPRSEYLVLLQQALNATVGF